MAASEARGRGGARDGSLLEQYVRQLLRDADRMRRSTQTRTRSDRAGRVDRPLVKPLPRRSQSPTTDHPPPPAG